MNAVPLHIVVPSLNIIFCSEKYIKSYAPSLGLYNPDMASSATAQAPDEEPRHRGTPYILWQQQKCIFSIQTLSFLFQTVMCLAQHLVLLSISASSYCKALNYHGSSVNMLIEFFQHLYIKYITKFYRMKEKEQEEKQKCFKEDYSTTVIT